MTEITKCYWEGNKFTPYKLNWDEKNVLMQSSTWLTSVKAKRAYEKNGSTVPDYTRERQGRTPYIDQHFKEMPPIAQE